MKKRNIRLLVKITFVFIIFAFIAFYSSAVFLTNEADEFINANLESKFNNTEERLKHHISKGREIESLQRYAEIKPLVIIPDTDYYPVFSDTTIYDAELEIERTYKKKTAIINVNGRYYEVTIIRLIEDFMRLREDIFGSLIPAFILLAVSFVIFSYLLSGYYFRPFNKILELMRIYKVGQKSDVKKITTSTLEFNNMQDLFHEMIYRIEGDYKRLKEYTEHMAHEIQTPLTIIRNKTENLISDPSVMDKHSETVKIIYEETNHLSKLGTTLNLLTKIENNEFNKAENVATKNVIEKHLSAVSEILSLKSLSVETELSDEHSIFIDPNLFDVIVKNLLNNAINYTPSNGNIKIQTTNNKLIFRNTGEVLPFQEMKIFERFQRNNSSRNSLGLGLALVKKICDINNLNIEYSYTEKIHSFTIAAS
ncbi:MAG: HAMP domain-containing histidine kinase [Bacteroidetes bacterium]|nr:HAMP domain-containing histidine kinase [Bacteroidota bacterium]